MRLFRRAALLGGLTLALVLGTVGLVRSGETPDGDLVTVQPSKDRDKTLWNGWGTTGHWPPSSTMKPADKPPEKTAARPEKPPVPVQPAFDSEREKNAYWRRLAVCDRLKEVALQTNDMALMRQVEEVEQQVFEVYKMRSGMTGARAGRPGVDERVLDDKLGGARPDLMAAPSQNRNNASRTASAWEGQR
jgi:hypothetical protein